MHITMIHGQSHQGSTYHIGKAFIEKLSTTEHVDEFFLPRDLNCFCMGCYQCLESDEQCPYYKGKINLKRVSRYPICWFLQPRPIVWAFHLP